MTNNFETSGTPREEEETPQLVEATAAPNPWVATPSDSPQLTTPTPKQANKGGLVIGAVLAGSALLLSGFFIGKAVNETENSMGNGQAIAQSGPLGPGGANGNGQQGNQGTSDGRGNGIGFGRGIMGTIKSLNGTELVLTTRSGDINVTIPANTPINQAGNAGTATLKSGQVIMVTTTDNNGTKTAVRITVLPGGILPPGGPGDDDQNQGLIPNQPQGQPGTGQPGMIPPGTGPGQPSGNTQNG